MPKINEHSWIQAITFTRVLFLLLVLALMVLPCPGPDITRAYYQFIRKYALMQSGEGIYQIPLRWCIVEGGTTQANPMFLGYSDTDSIIFDRMMNINETYWIPGASIAFRSAFTSQVEDGATFPVIPDSYPSPAYKGLPGDINIDLYAWYGGDNVEIELAIQIADCEKAWDDLELEYETNLEGIIALSVNQFINDSGQPSSYVGYAGSAFPCVPANSLRAPICENVDNLQENIDAYVAVRDVSYEQDFRTADFKDITLGHELGHALLLGHGDGIDNDDDGMFDECCDADENPSATPYTMMSPNSGQARLGGFTELQRNFAWAVADHTPGVVFDPPAVYRDGSVVSDRRVDGIRDVENATVDMVWAGISENKDTDMITVSFKILGVITGEVGNRYVMIADLDNNPETGGLPANLGFSAPLRGTEMLAVVTVDQGSGYEGIELTPELWVETNGAFTEVPADDLLARISSISEAESKTLQFSVVNLVFPSSRIETIGQVVKFQAVSQDASGKYVDYLPDTLDGSVLYMTPPKYPGCTVSPGRVEFREDVTVKAWGLVPNQGAEVYIAQEMVGSGNADKEGNLSVDVVVPQLIREGEQMLTVRSKETGLSADCVLEAQAQYKADIFDVAFVAIKVAVLAVGSAYLIGMGYKKLSSRKVER